MSQNLYQDAIADARKLREMAEQSAKNKIIDAVTPRIRDLIESQLLGEDMHEDELPAEGEEEVVVDLDSLTDEVPEMEMTSVDAGLPPMDIGSPSQGGETEVKVSPDGAISVDVGDVSIEVQSDDDSDEDLVLGQEIAEALAKIIKTRGNAGQLSEKVDTLEKRWSLLRRGFMVAKATGTSSQRRKVARIYESLAREAVTLRREVILTEHRQGSEALEKARIDLIIKEMKKMSGRNNRNIFDFLFEAEGDEPTEAHLDLDVVLEEDEEEGGDLEAAEEEVAPEDVDVDAASDALEDLGLALGLELEIGDDEEGGDEMAGEEELDLGGEEMEETYEIDEAALRRELRRMRARRINENDPVDGSGDSSFGGGNAGDEPFVDVDEDDLLNALADELGDSDDPDVEAMSGDVGMPANESRRRRARRARRSRTASRSSSRSMRKRLGEHKRAVAALKGQLTEMNLFNAKLLYANKLMQNRNLTAKQQRAIVEALDNAKTLREAKLLYKSLTTSLNKGTKRSLSEGQVRRPVGSSSRSTRSAQPAKSGVEVDRWAVLAGLSNDN
jgi:hypothetical protein